MKKIFFRRIFSCSGNNGVGVYYFQTNHPTGSFDSIIRVV
jgi:hypothetical protein